MSMDNPLAPAAVKPGTRVMDRQLAKNAQRLSARRKMPLTRDSGNVTPFHTSPVARIQANVGMKIKKGG